jgi:hypothetical protein
MSANRPTVYIETSVVSYLVGWLNRNSLLVASNQELTREWWLSRRGNFELFSSTVVVDEVRKGDDKLAAERLRFLTEIELLEVTAEAHNLVVSCAKPEYPEKRNLTRCTSPLQR